MRVCSGPGCLRAVADATRYCDECAAASPGKPSAGKPGPGTGDGIRTHTSGYDEELDRLRKGRRWQGVRARLLQRSPMCARCRAALADIVDHIVPARKAIAQAQASRQYPADRWAGYFLQSNLQGLCRPCHGAKTLEDKAHVGPWPDVVETARAAPRKVWTF